MTFVLANDAASSQKSIDTPGQLLDELVAAARVLAAALLQDGRVLLARQKQKGGGRVVAPERLPEQEVRLG